MLTRKLEEKSRELNQMKRNLEADLRREMEKNKRVLAEERQAKQVSVCMCDWQRDRKKRFRLKNKASGNNMKRIEEQYRNREHSEQIKKQ